MLAFLVHSGSGARAGVAHFGRFPKGDFFQEIINVGVAGGLAGFGAVGGAKHESQRHHVGVRLNAVQVGDAEFDLVGIRSVRRSLRRSRFSFQPAGTLFQPPVWSVTEAGVAYTSPVWPFSPALPSAALNVSTTSSARPGFSGEGDLGVKQGAGEQRDKQEEQFFHQRMQYFFGRKVGVVGILEVLKCRICLLQVLNHPFT